MTQQDDVIALRARLLDAGYQPVAVRTFAKAPVGLAWQATKGMPKYDRDAASTGILCGQPRGADLDIDDEAAATEIATMIEAIFGPAPVRVRSNSPRRLLVYRSDPPRPKRTIRLSIGTIEFLGTGQMFVAYGGHPSGVPYRWNEPALDATPLEELRTVSAEQEDAFQAAVEARWPVFTDSGDETAAKRPNGASESRSGGKADFRNTCLVEDVEAALADLPNDYDRTGWVKIGMACHAGGASYDAFDRWSRKWSGYDEKATRIAWTSFSKTHSVTEATLFDEIFKRCPGWRKPSEREREAGEAHPAGEDWEDEGATPGAGSANARTEPPKGALPFTLFDEVDISGRKGWILKGVLARGETSTWIAPPGKLKSALLTEIAVHVAAGWDWRGHLNKERCGVVYFALERGDLVKRRLAAYRARLDLAGLPIAVVSRTINLMDPQCVAVMLATIKAVEVRVGQSVGFVVIDTIAKGIAAGGGDEDKAKDKGRAFAHLRQVQEGANVHLGLVGHTGKDEDRGSRGSNADLGDADMQVQIRGEATKYADVIKANDRAEGPLVSFRGLLHDFGEDEDGDTVTVNILDPEVLEAGRQRDTKAGKLGLTPAARVALNALREAVSEMGQTPPASNHIPAKAVCVTVEEWRGYSYRMGISAGEDRAQQRAFRRAVEILVAAKHVGIWEPWVWTV